MKVQNIKRFDILELNGTPKKKILILETIRKKSDFISNNWVYRACHPHFYPNSRSLVKFNWTHQPCAPAESLALYFWTPLSFFVPLR